MTWRKWTALFVAWMALAGCARQTPTPLPLTATPTPTPVLTPYVSPTWTPRPSPVAGGMLPTPTWPTPTPFVHVIRQGDTLLGIALRYGVSLEALQAANPGVDPGFLPVGATLVVPLSEENPAGLPTPTPVPLPLGTVACYPQVDGTVWCFVEALNDGDAPVEGLGALVVWGEHTAMATALHDVLRPGERTVLLARLSGRGEGPPRAYWLTALQSDAEALAARYRFGAAEVVQAEGLPGRWVRFTLRITWPQSENDAALRRLWVVALGYADDGRPVAVRRWALRDEALQTGPPATLEVVLGSAGPPIAQVRWVVEGRP